HARKRRTPHSAQVPPQDRPYTLRNPFRGAWPATREGFCVVGLGPCRQRERGLPVVEENNPVNAVLERICTEVRPLADGRVADYIPELAHADPNIFGIAAISAHGRRYVAGDVEVPFSVQSISKPFVYAIAVEE